MKTHVQVLEEVKNQIAQNPELKQNIQFLIEHEVEQMKTMDAKYKNGECGEQEVVDAMTVNRGRMQVLNEILFGVELLSAAKE